MDIFPTTWTHLINYIPFFWSLGPSSVKLCQKIELELRIWPRSFKVFYSKDGFFILHSGRQDVDAASGHNHVAGSF